MPPTALILPGYLDSGPDHWQTRWESVHPEFRRVRQRDWEHPVRADWVAVLEEAVSRADPGVFLIAHSLGALLVAHWAERAGRTGQRVAGALLVAPPDPDRLPSCVVGFSPLPRDPLPFPSLLVASTDDPWAGIDDSRALATAWHSRFVCAGAQGHLNAESGLGEWPAGLALFRRLIESAPRIGISR